MRKIGIVSALLIGLSMSLPALAQDTELFENSYFEVGVDIASVPVTASEANQQSESFYVVVSGSLLHERLFNVTAENTESYDLSGNFAEPMLVRINSNEYIVANVREEVGWRF